VIKAMIVGASGYTGTELIRLLAGHPEATIMAATSETYAGQRASESYPHLVGQADVEYLTYEAAKELDADVVFAALPHGLSMGTVAEQKTAGRKVIDLSGDFRLESAAAYEKWYGTPHTEVPLLAEAVYGLPELNKQKIAAADLVSNPGCYPTSAVLALLPALASKLVSPAGIIIDSISGVSGAGRTANAASHFCARADNVAAYKTGGTHQHLPEIERFLSQTAGSDVTVSFTPHLGPYSRGIYTTAYATLEPGVTITAIRDAYLTRYAGCPFVQVLGPAEMPQLKAVVGSNFCHLGLAVDERAGRVIVLSAIDNLVKGASGQAIQNMNLMFGLPEETGLTQVGLWP
jgi:N-acetyl-gamma-glutamyl-phosphate reductase